MASRENLQQQFADLGVDPNDEVLDKCIEICILKDIDVEEFVETWMAYSLSHLDGAEPTVESILQMEQKEFTNKNVTTTPKQNTTPVRVYNSSLNNSTVIDGNDVYCATPKRSVQNGPRGLGSTEKTLFSPASYSPDVGTPSSTYKVRKNANQIALSHGNVSNVKWSSNRNGWVPSPVTSYVINKDEPPISSSKQRLMMDSVAVKIDIYNDHIDNLSKIIIDEKKLAEPSQFICPSLEKFITTGCIFCLDDRLQKDSVGLQTSATFSNGMTIELNFSDLLQPNNTCTGLFPGQVVAIEGVNPLPDKLIVHRIFSPQPLQLARIPTLEDSLQIVVAAGPFTQSDNLLYEPLQDLIAYVKENNPHLLIVVGPIVDAAHPMIIDGSLAETYEEFHDKVVSGIMDQLANCSTQVVVVASSRDIVHCPVYPVVPIINKQLPRLLTVTDPGILEINGLVIGISAIDILMHLSRVEMPLPSQSGGDRLGRLASHLLTQHNFYPLHPPADDVLMDTSMWENLCNLPVTPHILILPSDLRYFIKNVGDCVVVNPERLAKGLAGGFFSRINILASKDVTDWSPATHIAGQILKI